MRGLLRVARIVVMASVDETMMGSCVSESPVAYEQLMEKVVRKDNILRAVKRVVENRGSAGVDGMRVEELRPYLREHWKTLRAELVGGSYKPQAVRRVEIPNRMAGCGSLASRRWWIALSSRHCCRCCKSAGTRPSLSAAMAFDLEGMLIKR